MILLAVMTIAQLFVQMSQNLSQAPADMNDLNKARVVRAANAGYGEFIEALPDVRRRSPRNVKITASVTKTISVTQGSASITFSPTWADQANYIGSSMRISGSASYNKLAALNTLWGVWDGSSGDVSVEIFNDAILLGLNNHEAIQGDVSLVWDGNASILGYGYPPFLTPGQVRPYYAGQPSMATDGTMQFSVAIPANWWIEPLNPLSNGASPQFLMRVWPQPDRDYHLSFFERLWPDALTVADISSTTVLPVLAREEVHLVNLCQRGLISSNLWIGSANKDDAEKDYAMSIGVLGRQSNHRPTSQPNMVRTKRFF